MRHTSQHRFEEQWPGPHRALFIAAIVVVAGWTFLLYRGVCLVAAMFSVE